MNTENIRAVPKRRYHKPTSDIITWDNQTKHEHRARTRCKDELPRQLFMSVQPHPSFIPPCIEFLLRVHQLPAQNFLNFNPWSPRMTSHQRRCHLGPNQSHQLTQRLYCRTSGRCCHLLRLRPRWLHRLVRPRRRV